MIWDVIVIGAGASGLTASISAAEEGAKVAILEHTGRAGKKLLSTGNGRCNLTNLAMPKGAYRSDQTSFPKKVLERFTVEETLEFFRGLGICFVDKGGYIYPASGQAASVVEALLYRADHLGITVLYDCCAERVSRRGASGLLSVKTSKESMITKTVILAAGSQAAPKTGSDGSGYLLAQSLGHKIIKPLPALVQLKCSERYLKRLAGVRAEGSVTLTADGKFLARDKGELQLTDYGISGIPVFQVSRYASKALDQGKQVNAFLDFLPSMEEEELNTFLTDRAKKLDYLKAGAFLNGFLNRKLSDVLIGLSQIDREIPAGAISKSGLKRLGVRIKSMELHVVGANSLDHAQVCCGGVDTGEVNPSTMESLLAPGFFLAGEILDVDAICGGYNLQWAWSTGMIAGRAAKRRAHDTN